MTLHDGTAIHGEFLAGSGWSGEDHRWEAPRRRDELFLDASRNGLHLSILNYNLRNLKHHRNTPTRFMAIRSYGWEESAAYLHVGASASETVGLGSGRALSNSATKCRRHKLCGERRFEPSSPLATGLAAVT